MTKAKTMQPPVTNNLSDEWKVHTPNFLQEILKNNSTGILYRPMQIFASLLQQVAQRALEIDDPELNLLMCRLTLYGTADMDSPDYDKALVDELKRRVAAIKASKPPVEAGKGDKGDG
jgi:hypothetical protein